MGSFFFGFFFMIFFSTSIVVNCFFPFFSDRKTVVYSTDQVGQPPRERDSEMRHVSPKKPLGILACFAKKTQYIVYTKLSKDNVVKITAQI